MLELHGAGEPVDALTLVEHLKQAGQLEAVGGRGTVDLLAGSVPAVGNVRQYAQIVRENAMLRRLLNAAYEIQSKVRSHEAPPRELVERAERTILEVAHEDPEGLPLDRGRSSTPSRKLQSSRARGKAMTGTASGFEDLDDDHRRLPARQSHHPRRKTLDGKVLNRSTLIYDPRAGPRRRMDDLAAPHRVRRGDLDRGAGP